MYSSKTQNIQMHLTYNIFYIQYNTIQVQIQYIHIYIYIYCMCTSRREIWLYIGTAVIRQARTILSSVMLLKLHSVTQNSIIFKIIVDLGVRRDTRCEKYSNFCKRSDTNCETVSVLLDSNTLISQSDSRTRKNCYINIYIYCIYTI